MAGRVSRREALRYGIAGAVAASVAVTTRDAAAAGTDAGGYEVIANAFGFGVDIPGCADASRSIREISIDELRIEARELTGEPGDAFRSYAPGPAECGTATFRSIPGGAGLRSWFDECRKGHDVRKNITVTLYKKDKSPGRSYLLYDCFPTQWSSVSFDTSSTVQTETLTVKIGRLEFRT